MSFFITGLLKNSCGAGKMAEGVKVLSTKPDDLSLIPESHRIGENRLSQVRHGRNAIPQVNKYNSKKIC